MTIPKHKCTLDPNSSPYSSIKTTKWSGLSNYLRELTLVTHHHPDTYTYFQSYPTVMAERHRQVLEGGKWVVHPLSKISLVWNSINAIVNIMHMLLSTFRLSFILDPNEPKVHPVDNVLVALHIICILDIFSKFNEGFREGIPVNFVLDKRRIIGRYLCSWFFLDFLSSVPWAYILLYRRVLCMPCLFAAHVIAIIRVSRLCTALKNFETLIKVFSKSYFKQRLFSHAVALIVTMHWSTCFVYLIPVIGFYFKDSVILNNYRGSYFNNSTTTANITGLSVANRYKKALFLSVSSFFGTGMSMYKKYSPDEYIIYSLIILYTAMFMVYSTVVALDLYLTAYSSSIKYQGLVNQVEAYMQHRQFPIPLKKRVRTYYNYKYLEKYYKEDSVLNCLSDQLRQEIKLHTCHKFVNKIKLLDGQPADVVGAFLSSLKPELYLANDLVVRGGDIGDCMYFIAYGTVAVYSLKGAEICHLEDGGHFGSVALLMRDNKRVATVVTIEITQLYRLDAIDFRKCIMSNPILRERIEAIAAKRMHETVVIDEAFRMQQKIKREQHIYGKVGENAP